MLSEIEHVKVDYDRGRYAGHPRQGGIFHFGDGEIAIIYNRAPCRYQVPSDVGHDLVGYHSRAQVILARSLDGGRTWSRRNDVIIFDEARRVEERRAFVRQAEENASVHREAVDLNCRDAAVFFGRTWAGEGDPPTLLCYALRSADRGHTWESVPTPVRPPSTGKIVEGGHPVIKDGHPLVAMPDGTHLAAMTHSSGVWLYGSDDDGCTWEPIALICGDPTGFGRPTYAGLILLPSGRLQCYTLNIGGRRDAIQLCYSDDGGYSWSEPKPIVRWGQSPWAARPRSPAVTGTGAFGKFYRSPWALRLRDGRIAVLFGRRKPPYGIGLTVSEDRGATWSAEHILRDDASGPDIAYPVAVELEPGRIFAAYYFMLDDGNGFGGTRFIAGTHFRL